MTREIRNRLPKSTGPAHPARHVVGRPRSRNGLTHGTSSDLPKITGPVETRDKLPAYPRSTDRFEPREHPPHLPYIPASPRRDPVPAIQLGCWPAWSAKAWARSLREWLQVTVPVLCRRGWLDEQQQPARDAATRHVLRGLLIDSLGHPVHNSDGVMME